MLRTYVVYPIAPPDIVFKFFFFFSYPTSIRISCQGHTSETESVWNGLGIRLLNGI